MINNKINPLLLCLTLVACSQQQAGALVVPQNSITAEVIYQSHQCGQSEPRALWINTQQQLQQIYSGLRHSFVADQLVQPPAVDFSRDGVLLLAMGQKRTGGYGLKVAETPTVVNGLLEVKVQWLEPKPGMMVTQALTSPCLLVKISQGGFSKIRVADQWGKIRFEIKLD